MNKFKQWLYKFMYGRYGNDQLNKTLFWITLILIFADLFITGTARYIVSSVTLILIFIVYYRMLSRSIYKRRKENEKFVQLINRIKNLKYYRYYSCPNCKTKIRVPKGRGKIEITCPKCKNRFIRKS